MIHDEVPQEQSNWVRSCPLEFKLGNWQIIEQPGVSVANIM